MWSLSKGSLFLWGVSIERLNTLYSTERNAKAKLRLLAAIRRKKWDSIDTIADVLEKPRRTIHGWLHRFEERGILGSQDKKQPGRTSKLTKTDLKKLRRDLLKGPAHVPGRIWTTKLMGEHIERKHGVKYAYDNVYRLLHMLGFSIQKPRQQHYKADKNAQEQFKKKLGASYGSIVVMDGRFHVSTNAQSTSRLTSQEVGHLKEVDQS